MSQRIIEVLDYKMRNIGECYMLADGGIAFQLNYGANTVLLSRDTTDEVLRLLLDDRRERGVCGPHVGNFAGDI